jgi:zinc transporter ZupT
MTLLTILFGVDVFGTAIGIYAMKSRAVGGKFKAISAGVMVGVALFWIFPDLMEKSGAVHATLVIAVGLATLCGIDRFVFPICPCCTHREDSGHAHGARGTLIPLVIAICVHNLFDGWIAAVAGHTGGSPSSALAVGLIAHKVPEALVFGLMLRSATSRSKVAFLNACLTGFAILAGGAAHGSLRTLSGTAVVASSLALACSSFLFVGAHIFLGQRRCAGMRSALAPLLLGLLASAVMQHTVATVLAP